MAIKKPSKRAPKQKVHKVEVESEEPSLKLAEKVAPRDWANDPAWLRYLLAKSYDLMPDPVVFREDADPQECAELLAQVGFVIESDDASPGSDEEESE